MPLEKQERAARIAVRVLTELQGCFEDNDNGSAILEGDSDTYEERVKDFLQGLNMATATVVQRLTGNDVDVLDSISTMTRVAFEYSSNGDNEG